MCLPGHKKPFAPEREEIYKKAFSPERKDWGKTVATKPERPTQIYISDLSKDLTL